MTKVAIMGYGVVGSGLIELIDKNREYNREDDIKITSILVRNKEKHLNSSHNEVITTDVEEFFSIKSDVVIEVIGGLHPAYDYVKRALALGKHVVTANKDLIATFGHELFQLAQENNVSLKFEAAVAGGIPIIKPLTESLYGNGISSIKAILNGTTNFILTKMDGENLSYEEALSEAQQLGFAEANPEFIELRKQIENMQFSSEEGFYLSQEIINRYVYFMKKFSETRGKNEFCSCGSNLKYKNCCGKEE